jgi:lipopolysaccharide transport system ATP-binding protein
MHRYVAPFRSLPGSRRLLGLVVTFLKANNVVVDFPIYGGHSRSLKTTLMRAATGGALARGAGERIVVRALDRVSFEFAEDDRVALVGHNGSGKSTLLRVLAGAYEPVGGRVELRGRVASMLSVSLGMDLESTGYENIRLQGILFGMSNAEIERKRGEIAEFTELGDYLSMPVRTYSSGMMMRISFGVATAVDAEIILMDEWLGIGDANFFEKADRRIKEFVSKAGILVFASHSLDLLRKVCNKAVMLEHGRVAAVGDLEEVLAAYAAA